MKHILSVVILFVAVAGSCQINVWRVQNPLFRQVTDLRGVQMLSATSIVACGSHGVFIQSADFGTSWLVSNPLGFTGSFNAIYFLDALHGVIAGDSGKVFQTSDGGYSWSDISIVTAFSVRSLTAIDNKIILAVSENSIWKTTNSGFSWTNISLNEVKTYTTIRKINSDFINVCGLGAIFYRTPDQGTTWTRIHITTSADSVFAKDIYGQVFTSISLGTVVGQSGSILHTTNGGGTWVQQQGDTLPVTADLIAVDGKDANVLCAVGGFGTIVHTNDGGMHWSRVRIGVGDSINAISFFDTYNATAVGNNGTIIMTTDGGASWRFSAASFMTDNLHAVAFPIGDTSHGIVAGDFGTIMRTIDGGQQWLRSDSRSNAAFFGVTFTGSDRCCAVGAQGTIVRSFDAGTTWNSAPSGTTNTLRSVSFANAATGWACGDYGTLISTTDAGATWRTHTLNTRRNFTAISFPDSLHGYLASDHGVYKTTDGGLTWQDPDDYSYYIHVNSLCAPTDNVVSVASDNIHKCPVHLATSTDGTSDWTDTLIRFGVLTNYNGVIYFNGYFSGICFADSLHGTAVGGEINAKLLERGHIFHTLDGGKTWHEQPVNSGFNLNGVSFGSRQAGTAVGNGGLILRITTDE